MMYRAKITHCASIIANIYGSDDAEMSRETINRYKISNDLFEHFLNL